MDLLVTIRESTIKTTKIGSLENIPLYSSSTGYHENSIPITCKILKAFINFGRYLNDVYTLEIREGTSLQWVCPTIEGPTPCPRESPAAVTVGNNRLLIYGGMNGKRLGDVWIMDVGEIKHFQ